MIGPSLYSKSRSTTKDIHLFSWKSGHLNVTFAKGFRTPFADAFVEACAENGIPVPHPDYNGKMQEGAIFSVYN